MGVTRGRLRGAEGREGSRGCWGTRGAGTGTRSLMRRTRGWWDCGVTLRSGWLTDKGLAEMPAFLARAEGRG